MAEYDMYGGTGGAGSMSMAGGAGNFDFGGGWADAMKGWGGYGNMGSQGQGGGGMDWGKLFGAAGGALGLGSNLTRMIGGQQGAMPRMPTTGAGPGGMYQPQDSSMNQQAGAQGYNPMQQGGQRTITPEMQMQGLSGLSLPGAQQGKPGQPGQQGPTSPGAAGMQGQMPQMIQGSQRPLNPYAIGGGF